MFFDGAREEGGEGSGDGSGEFMGEVGGEGEDTDDDGEVAEGVEDVGWGGE